MYDKIVWIPTLREAAAHTIHQRKLALLLLMFGILANDHHMALALDDLAFFADRLDRRTNFHLCYLLNLIVLTEQP